ncbi:MAG: hypothetical protein HY704_17230 [Gemmatimonadetes bacterium]|nr:hypothetical protein [Gemmatimonadota bacterium]
MPGQRLRHVSLVALALIGLVSACEGGSDVGDSVTGPLVPEFGNGLSKYAHGAHYTLLRGQRPDGTPHVAEWIGREGGVLRLAGHRLKIPAGAVDAPTLFLLVPAADGYVEVKLQALRGSTDVGEKGFRKPVELSLTYGWATNVTNPRQLLIVHLVGDSREHLEPVKSLLDESSRTVTARLKHFSRYAIAQN